jgi:hypothetical protein
MKTRSALKPKEIMTSCSRCLLFCMVFSGLLSSPLWSAESVETEAKTISKSGDQKEGSPELTEEATKAIESGLKYLLKVQAKDGSWSTGRHQMACTSLGLMSFMVKGEFPGYGPNAKALDRAKNWMLKKAKSSADGYLGSSMYEHGMATLALSEMWGMTKGEKDDEDIQRALQNAVNVILRSQNVGGGWRYKPSPDAGEDTSVTVMVFIGLASARQAGIVVPDEHIKRLVRYLEGAQDQGTGGFSYAPTGKGVSIACSGGGLYVSQLAGQRDSQMVKAALNYVSNLPDGVFANTGSYYYTHYYAVQSMVQSGDEHYAAWYPKIRDALIDKQAKDGSWAGAKGGTIQGTGMAVIILGTPHCYIPIYQR